MGAHNMQASLDDGVTVVTVRGQRDRDACAGTHLTEVGMERSSMCKSSALIKAFDEGNHNVGKVGRRGVRWAIRYYTFPEHRRTSTER
jgi:hypothetical protein